MRTAIACSALALWAIGAVAGPAGVQGPDPRVTAFAGLEGARGADYADYLLEVLADWSLDDENWRGFFRSYFQTYQFTPSLAEFWQYALRETGGTLQAIVARRSALSGAYAVQQGLGAALAQGGAASDSVVAALLWLQAIAGSLSNTDRTDVAIILSGTTKGQTKGLVPAAGLPPVQDPQSAYLGTQLAWTLVDYRGSARGDIPSLLGLEGTSRAFWDATGILLLDNNALTEAHVTSLLNLVKVIPKGLHAVAAVCVPQAMGMDLSWPGFGGTHQAILVPATPMAAQTDPREFSIISGRPVAPLFTITAAEQFARAIQAVQFQRRPELVVRRDAILMDAQSRRTRYLRQTISASLYMEQPDELLPAIGYLWFIDTEATFRQAFDLLQLRERGAMDQFLLFADLMSGGGDTTPLYLSDLDGGVARMDTAIGRTTMGTINVPVDSASAFESVRPVEVRYVTAIEIGGSVWTFFLDEQGRTADWSQQ